jgi:hypothetical protein
MNTFPGRVRNGVVVLEQGTRLPEGAAVTVCCALTSTLQPVRKKRRVVLPLVKSKRPGSLPLTGERIAQLLEEEDAAHFGKFFKQAES